MRRSSAVTLSSIPRNRYPPLAAVLGSLVERTTEPKTDSLVREGCMAGVI